MSHLTVLQTAYQILTPTGIWCRRANALNNSGQPVPILSPSAVRFDVYGALLKAWYDLGEPLLTLYQAYEYAKNRIPNDYKNRDMESYNDEADVTKTHILYLLSTGEVEVDFLVTDTGDFIVTDTTDFIIL